MDRASCFLDLGRDTSACLMLIAVLLYYGNSLVTFVWISSDRVCSRLFPAVRCSPRMPRRSPCWSRDPLRSKRKEQYEKAPHIVRNTEIESHPPPPRHNVTKMGERNIFLIHFLLIKISSLPPTSQWRSPPPPPPPFAPCTRPDVLGPSKTKIIYFL